VILPALMLAGATCPMDVAIPAGLAVPLATVDALSSKTNVKGDMVALRTAEDVRIGEVLVIPRATPATGQITDSRKKGAMGMKGQLTIRPLYLRAGGTVIRLTGTADKKGTLPAGSAVGFVLSAGFTGRSAVIPAGTPLDTTVERATTLRVEAPC
jgi:hypothetical protein